MTVQPVVPAAPPGPVYSLSAALMAPDVWTHVSASSVSARITSLPSSLHFKTPVADGQAASTRFKISTSRLQTELLRKWLPYLPRQTTFAWYAVVVGVVEGDVVPVVVAVVDRVVVAVLVIVVVRDVLGDELGVVVRVVVGDDVGLVVLLVVGDVVAVVVREEVGDVVCVVVGVVTSQLRNEPS